MLETGNRTLYGECLKAPSGYRFDQGIATTFTLDLETLLTLPVTLATQRATEPEELLRDPVGLLEGIRGVAQQLTVYCQDGRIHVPAREQRLFCLLEEMVVPVTAKNGGVFHPKLWLLRFVHDDAPPLLRAVVLSRNLTYDRSWDIVVGLEGTPGGRRVAASYGLADLLEALPGSATLPLDDARKTTLEELLKQVRHTAFEAPGGFDGKATFHAIGLRGMKRWSPKIEGKRALAVSPFVKAAPIAGLRDLADELVLIARDDQLDRVPAGTLEGCRVQVLADGADPAAETAETEDDAKSPEMTSHRGLHAKMLAIEHGHGGSKVTWWLGSANLTDAAWSGLNVEIMVELSGRRRDVGIDVFLSGGFGKLLATYQRAEPNPDELLLEKAVEKAEIIRDELISAPLTLGCEREDEKRFGLFLKGAVTIPDDVTVSAWPVTLRSTHSRTIRNLSETETVRWDGMSPASLCSVLAFSVTAKHESKDVTIHFARRLPATGFPEDRSAHIVRDIVSSRAGFLRYLRLLLSMDPSMGLGGLGAGGGGAGTGSSVSGLDWEGALLEELVRAVSRQPDRLEAIQKLVDDLSETPEGRELIPEDFFDLWSAIRSVREERSRV